MRVALLGLLEQGTRAVEAGRKRVRQGGDGGTKVLGILEREEREERERAARQRELEQEEGEDEEEEGGYMGELSFVSEGVEEDEDEDREETRVDGLPSLLQQP
jgi:hypothetical protein